MKVLLTSKLHDFVINELSKKYLIDVHSGKIPISRKQLQTKIKDVDGLVCFPYDMIDAEVIDSAKSLKAISTYSVGFDHIDIAHAKKRKIRVGYTPGVLTDATADLTFSLILDVARRVTEGDRMIRTGEWSQIYGAYEYVGIDLHSKTLGILGMGRIGEAVAKRALAFNMDVIYHNRKRISRHKERRLKARYVDLEELIAASDILSIHVPHTKETDGMFNANTFKEMKQSSILINTARGKIVNQSDLVNALKRGTIAGAGLDVFESEPIKKNDPLTRLQNVVMVPHIGSSTTETRINMARLTIRNLHLGMAGKKPICSVGY